MSDSGLDYGIKQSVREDFVGKHPRPTAFHQAGPLTCFKAWAG